LVPLDKRVSERERTASRSGPRYAQSWAESVRPTRGPDGKFEWRSGKYCSQHGAFDLIEQGERFRRRSRQTFKTIRVSVKQTRLASSLPLGDPLIRDELFGVHPVLESGADGYRLGALLWGRFPVPLRCELQCFEAGDVCSMHVWWAAESRPTDLLPNDLVRAADRSSSILPARS